MKNFFSIFIIAVAGLMVSCNNTAKTTNSAAADSVEVVTVEEAVVCGDSVCTDSVCADSVCTETAVDTAAPVK